MRFIHKLARITAVALLLGAGIGRSSIVPTLDLGSGFIDVVYTASSGTFTGTGSALQLFINDSAYAIVSGPSGGPYVNPGSFSMAVRIDTNGNMVPNTGTVTIGGFVQGVAGFGDLGDPTTADSLLTANVIGFSYAPLNDGELDFTLDATGGALALLFDGPAKMVMTQLGDPTSPDADPPGAGFPGSFSGDFQSFSTGAVADINNVPEPGGLVMAASALAALVLQRRRLRRS
jgi:hypothetical protein